MKENFRRLSVAFILIFSTSLPSVGASLVNYQGVLVNANGTSFSSKTADMSFAIYPNKNITTPQTPLWSEVHFGVQIDKGVYNIILGDVASFPENIFLQHNELWLEVNVNGETLMPRIRFNGALYSIEAINSMGIMSNTNTFNHNRYTDNEAVMAVASNYYTKEHVDILEDRIRVLEEKIDSLLAKISVTGNDVYIKGANLHIENGSGRTDTTNGLGNLIVGYNKADVSDNRSGSHNIVVGNLHSYASYGGLVAGYNNSVTGIYSSVSGGNNNTSMGNYSSVSGGGFNVASGNQASVNGGFSNKAVGKSVSISGGHDNAALGEFSTVSGGGFNVAGDPLYRINPGNADLSKGKSTSINGGNNRTAINDYSSEIGNVSEINTGILVIRGG